MSNRKIWGGGRFVGIRAFNMLFKYMRGSCRDWGSRCAPSLELKLPKSILEANLQRVLISIICDPYKKYN